MKKVKNCLYRFSALWSAFMVPIAPVSLYGVVYNLSRTVWLRWFIGRRARDVFTAYSYFPPYRSISPRRGSAYAYAGVCINPAVGVSDRMDITAGLSFVSTSYGAGRRRNHAILPKIPAWVWPLIYVAIGTGVNYLGIQQTVVNLIVTGLIQLGILAIFVLPYCPSNDLRQQMITLSFRPFSTTVVHSGLIATAISVAALNFLILTLSYIMKKAKAGTRRQ